MNDTIWLDDQKRSFVFQETEEYQILENPGRLTREGIEKKIDLWMSCNNRHALTKYRAMLKRCRRVTDSGFIEDSVSFRDAQGNTISKKIKLMIFSRNEDGTPRWTESVEEYKQANKQIFFSGMDKVKVEVKADIEEEIEYEEEVEEQKPKKTIKKKKKANKKK